MTSRENFRARSPAILHFQRWGDAPVHSMGAALFARKDQIHFFNDIGYRHPPFTHCPNNMKLRKENNCSCNPWGNFGT